LRRSSITPIERFAQTRTRTRTRKRTRKEDRFIVPESRDDRGAITDYLWRTITSRGIIGQFSLSTFSHPGRIGGMLFPVLRLFYYLVIRIQYRDVGFMRYWTVSQLPNFILVAPILVASIYGIYHYFYYYWQSAFRRFTHSTTTTTSRQSRPARSRSKSSTDLDSDLELRRTLWENPEAAPFFLIHTITTLILVFASHTQIALRVSMGNPVLFWIVGAFVSSSSSRVNHRRGGGGRTAKWARRGVVWSCTWGAVSLVLWAGFYPPA
jgi:hypothetical protein